MSLDSLASTPHLSVKFLNLIEFDEGSEFLEIKEALLYLESLVVQSDRDHPDVEDFALDLSDVARKLQTEYLHDRLNENAERLAEVNRLFETMPPETKGLHNLTLEKLIAPEGSNNITTDTYDKSLPVSSDVKASLLQTLKSKAKLKPKQLLKVLAACAALSLPSDKIQHPAGPEGMFQIPETLAPITEATRTRVNQHIWQEPAFEPPAVPSRLVQPALDANFNLLRQAPYPIEIVNNETDSMASRLQFVLNSSERRVLFESLRNNPEYRQEVALIALIESNLDVDAVSHSGAMGIMQDMGELQGAFGDPDTVEHLARIGLMPAIDNLEYNRIIQGHQSGIQMQRGTLLDYLIEQRNAGTEFWDRFETQQTNLLLNPETSAAIAHQYLEDLQIKAMQQLPINEEPLEALNFAVMAYNLGMSHLHTLRRLMAEQQIIDFNTHSVLSFMDRPDFEAILRDNNLSQLINNYNEAKHYLARFIALQTLIKQNHTITSGSTAG